MGIRQHTHDYVSVKQIAEEDDKMSSCSLSDGKVSEKILDGFEETSFELHFAGCNGCARLTDEAGLESKHVFAVCQRDKRYSKLHINYRMESDEETRQVGELLTTQLEKIEDLEVEWDGDISSTITVSVED